MNPRHLLARALGVEEAPPGSTCAVCGPSPFPPGPRGAKGCFGANFTDYDALALPSESTVCAGCERLLSGRPGDDPPPLRTRSVLAFGSGVQDIDRAGWWALLQHPDSLPGPCVLSWATSRKRHHWLHAGISTHSRWEVGTDHGTASWEPDPALAETLLQLLSLGARKAEVLAGHYPAHKLTPALRALDARLAPLRGSLILDLAVWAAPAKDDLPDPSTTTGDTDVLDPTDEMAADLVAELAWSSTMRVEDGIRFWAANGFLVRRLRRFAHRDLATLVSRLMSECGIGAEGGQRVARRVEALTEEQERDILAAIRQRPDLIAALAFDRVKTIRSERKADNLSLGV